jgi:hypothetical protein
MKPSKQVLDWLLEAKDPFLRYRVQKELLGKKFTKKQEDEIYPEIEKSAPVQGILAKMHPDGYWLHKTSKGKYIGEGTYYGGCATTHFCLAYLAELGITRRTKAVEKAAERYLNLQAPDGDWYRHLSCLIGYNVQTYVRLGYKDDKRLKKSIDLLRSSIRWDNGYLCDVHENKYKKRKTKSCYGGSLFALTAFSELGKSFTNIPECERVINYFLERNAIFKKTDLSQPMAQHLLYLDFPFLPAGRFFQILFYLSKLGRGNDPRLKKVWDLLESKKDAEGRFPLESSIALKAPWNVGERKKANRWVTFYAYLAMKYRDKD